MLQRISTIDIGGYGSLLSQGRQSLGLLAERRPERMSRVNPDDAKFAREELQLLQREGEIAVLGMAVDVGIKLRGEEVAVDHVAFQLGHVDAVGGEHVFFLGWKPDLRPTLQRWDIFALPSLDEGLPVSVLEAMAEGLPVVTTSVGGLPEIVAHGHTGYLVTPSDVVELSNHLRILLLDKNLRQTMGAAGRERVSQRFSVAGMVANIEAIYDSLLSSPLRTSNE